MRKWDQRGKSCSRSQNKKEQNQNLTSQLQAHKEVQVGAKSKDLCNPEEDWWPIRGVKNGI